MYNSKAASNEEKYTRIYASGLQDGNVWAIYGKIS